VGKPLCAGVGEYLGPKPINKTSGNHKKGRRDKNFNEVIPDCRLSQERLATYILADEGRQSCIDNFINEADNEGCQDDQGLFYAYNQRSTKVKTDEMIKGC